MRILNFSHNSEHYQIKCVWLQQIKINHRLFARKKNEVNSSLVLTVDVQRVALSWLKHPVLTWTKGIIMGADYCGWLDLQRLDLNVIYHKYMSHDQYRSGNTTKDWVNVYNEPTPAAVQRCTTPTPTQLLLVASAVGSRVSTSRLHPPAIICIYQRGI